MSAVLVFAPVELPPEERAIVDRARDALVAHIVTDDRAVMESSKAAFVKAMQELFDIELARQLKLQGRLS